MIDRRRPFAAFLALSVLLAACAAPTGPGPTPPATVSGSVATDGSPVLGTGLVLFDATELGVAGVGPAEVVEVGAGIYAGPISAAADGDFTLVLPDGDDLPAELLAPAANAFYNVDGVAGCAVVADVPSALVTYFAVGLGSLPGAYAVSVDSGFLLAIVADAALDFTAPTMQEALAGRTLYSWMYASEHVALSIEGAGCAGAVNIGVAGRVALAEGWNQVAWDVNGDFTLATLRDDDGSAALVLNVQDVAP